MSEEIKYSKSYEYIIISGNTGIVGITKEAADAIGEIYLVDLPEIGKDFKKDEAVAVVESVKSASDIFSPVGGRVTEVNENLKDDPELLTRDPLGEGWIFKMDISNPDEVNKLMNYEEFKQFINKEN